MSETRPTVSALAHSTAYLAQVWSPTPSSSFEAESTDRLAIGLSAASSILATLKQASSFAPVPALQEAAGLAIVLLEGVQGAKDNKAAYTRLAEDAGRFVININRIIQSLDKENLPKDLVEDLQVLNQTLREINQISNKSSSRKWIVQFLTHKSDAGGVAEGREKLTQAISFFSMKSHIYTRVQQNEANQVNAYRISADREERLRKNLKPVERDPKEGCMKGTREKILAKVFAWMEDTNQANILWLSGSPGAGKSAIASTVISELKSQYKHISSSFYFKRGDASLADPASLWRTIAFGLACQDPSIQKSINDALGKLELDSLGVGDHFKHLIEGSLSKCPSSQLVVIVIDALDECGSSSSRRSLLGTIQKWLQLPKNCKLLITSRPESDIERCLKADDVQHIMLQTGSQVKQETSTDIYLFLVHEFARIVEKYDGVLSPSWPEERTVKELTGMAAGLFIWAKTVVRFVEGGIPKKRLSLIMEEKFGTGDIDNLYLTILDNAFDNAEIDVVKLIIGTIIMGRVPMKDSDIQKLSQESLETVKFVLKNVQSVIMANNDQRFQITHK